MNPNFDPDNDHYDRASDENFEMTEEDEEQENSEEDAGEDDSSEEDYGVHRRGN